MVIEVNQGFFQSVDLHKGVYQEFQPINDIIRKSCAKGCSDHRPWCTALSSAQLITLHQQRANNQ